ncbi:MAG: carbamoyl-phosphate synthase large subunit [Desulfococcaceae bacterium]|jgi:carbamoyl-phosphate synthase large subunit|nr:carbamoyl-phosphate synthase large subunit [Desulfococcaceae bacterium]
MPRRDDIRKILIIGSGPLLIGQGGEYDCFGTQACRALHDQGYEVVTADADPAAVITDTGLAGSIYIEPLNVKIITEIISGERPDALLPNLGGQSALNLGIGLAKSGILAEFGVRMIGTDADAIRICQDRNLFQQTMNNLGIATPRSRIVSNPEEALEAAEKFGCPLVIHPAYSSGGTGGEMLYNKEDVPEAASRGIAASSIGQIMVEESLPGWTELEIILLRDAAGQTHTVCCVENIDPAGIHTGDSLCVIPPMTVSPELLAQLESQAAAIAEKIGVCGCIGIQFARHPEKGSLLVLEVNPRTSRTASLAARSCGHNLGAAAALLACGMRIEEIAELKNPPSPFPVTVKFPRWAFDKFKESEDRLGIGMQSAGEVIGMGGTFAEALQKAVRALDTGRSGLGGTDRFYNKTAEELLHLLGQPSSERMFILYEALCKGIDSSAVHEKTRIAPFFIQELAKLAELEKKLRKSRGTSGPLSPKLLHEAKKAGFADAYLGNILEMPEKEIRKIRNEQHIFPVKKRVGSGKTNPFFYFSYHHDDNAESERDSSGRKKILLMGKGPNRIGQSREFDSSCIAAAAAVREAGYAPLICSADPASVLADSGMSGSLFFEALTMEDILNIVKQEKPEGLILQFGGKSAMRMGRELEREGVAVFGALSNAAALAANRAGNRDLFRQTVRGLGIPQPRMIRAESAEEIRAAADTVSYPLMLCRADAGGIPRTEIFSEPQMLRDCPLLPECSPEQPVFVEEFLENALETEAAAITDGGEVFTAGIAEHVERAGIHPGDATIAIPPLMLSPLHSEIIRDYTRQIALALNFRGLLTVRFAISDNTVYALEARVGTSRTIPLISKVHNIPLAGLAAQIMLGKNLSELRPRAKHPKHFAVKKAVFPFDIFPETDPLPGPEMRSAGQVMGLSDSFGRAFFKSWEAGGIPLPLEGTVLFTVADRDKTAALEPARLFREMGFRIMATRGTQQFLEENGIASEIIKKMGYGRPDISDAIKNGDIQLVINTPFGRQSRADDSYIRKASVRYKVPNITTTAAALTAAKGIAARRTGKPKVKSLQKYYEEME